MPFGARVHARGGGEVIGRLRAPVEHDYQRDHLARTITAGDVELGGAASCLVAIRSRHELCTVGDDIVMRCWQRLRHAWLRRAGAVYSPD
jgi:hypothetical protein